MAEYIEREALLRSICNSCDGWCENTACDCANCKSEHRCDMVVEIAEFSAADVAPVVRCRNCAYREKIADLTHTIYCKWLDLPMPKDAFCSYGKRKDGEG